MNSYSSNGERTVLMSGARPNYAPPQQAATPINLPPRKPKPKKKSNTTLIIILASALSFLISFGLVFYYLYTSDPAHAPDTASNAINGGSNVEVDSVLNHDYIARQAVELQLRSKAVTDSELRGRDRDELRLLRNYVLAQYGMRFNEPDLQQFFEGYSWYTPQSDNVEAKLTDIERQNIASIQALENSL